MSKLGSSLLAVLIISLITSGAGQIPASTRQSDSTKPSYDLKAQSLLDLGVVQKKFVDLATAVPAEKLNWRPSADSRSFAEVFLHVAGERYGILALMGAPAPSGFDAKSYEKSTTSGDRIIEELNKSWEFTRKTIDAMNNAEFAKLLPKLGPQANAGDVIYILAADAHEHLGQCVAYARENGIVPPWTLGARKREAKKTVEQK